MSIPGKGGSDRIEEIILPNVRDLGGFKVRRALPSVQRRMVGPFIFFDQMGPVMFGAGEAEDVRPHPHIGLSRAKSFIATAPATRKPSGLARSTG
jgi:Pirin